MKCQPGFTDFFMSPVTGRIILPAMPDLYHNYVWLGDRNDRPLPSPIIIDLRLEIIDIRRRLSETRFILQAASQYFDSSQALNELVPGILKHNEGIVSIAFPWVDYVPVDLPYQNIWIGDIDSVPTPFPRIFVNNLPTMLSADPTLLLGAYNLYRGSPNPLILGQPEIVKTLHITNMADLTVGHLWLGTNSSDPLNYGSNRPVEIIVLPLANMADLPYQKIWRGTIDNRPFPVDDLTDLEGRVTINEGDITTINENITNINIELGDINIELGDINLNIDSIFDSLIDLQVQIDTNVASGLDHLADLQLQIDTNIASGLDALATINIRLDALELSVTTINSSIATINTTITTIQTAITGINTTITSILSSISTINTAITAIQGDIISINASISTINTTITSIQSDITTLYSDISTINASITSILSSISTINTTITTIQGDITTLFSDIAVINTSISTINTTLTTIASEITTINSTITTIQGDITNITTVLLPAVYTYIDTSVGDLTLSAIVAGGNVNLGGNRIINLQCDPEEDNDAVSFCFLWHILHDEVNVLWS